MKNLSAALEKYGMKTNIYQSLLPSITIIHLDQDANIYVDENDEYNFDTKTQLLKIKNKKSQKPYIVFDLNKITGFISTSQMGPCGVYL